MIRSRLRRPTSKSMTATFLPRLARPTAILALVVVLPTPPLPEVTTIFSVNVLSPMLGPVREGDEKYLCRTYFKIYYCDFEIGPALSESRRERFNQQTLAVEPGLYRFAVQFGWDLLEHAVASGNRHQFGLTIW